MAIIASGAESVHVKDSTKIKCPRCQSCSVALSSLMDDPNDITEDEDFAALYVTNTAAGYGIQGFVGLCNSCGHEWVPLWYMFDIATGAATKAVTFTNIVTTSAANLLAGLYCVPLDAAGTDIGKYYIVESNTKADPAVISMTVATNDNETGMWMITNILPLGRTAAS